MIQTKVRESQRMGANLEIALSIFNVLIRSKNFKGRNFDMEPKAIKRPSGIAEIKVTAKSMQLEPNPSVRD